MSIKHNQGFPAKNPLTSYWLKDPHPLASFRSSELVPGYCDIAIIGTGLAGVGTAYHILSDPDLRATKPNVVLLEARQACSGATGRNGGHLKLATLVARQTIVNFGYEAAEEVVGHQLNQLSALQDVAEKEKIDCELRVTRSFDIFFDESHATEMRDFIFACKAKDLAWARHIEWIEAPESDEVTGVKNTKGALSVPAVSLWPYKLVTGLLAKVLDLGGQLFTETCVETVEELTDSTRLTTSRGNINARRVVFATNAYTAPLLPQFHHVITPFKGQNSHLHPKSTFKPTRALDYTYNLHFDKKYADYLNPRPDNGIILGGAKWTYEDRIDKNEWWNTTDDTTLIIDAATEHFDSVMETHFIGWEEADARHDWVWTGIMGQTPDGLPHIGKVQGSNKQWLLAGFNGAGMLMIFTASRAIAEMVGRGHNYEDTDLPRVFKSIVERLAVKNPGFT